VSNRLKFSVLAVALIAGVAIGPAAYADATHHSGSPEGTAPQGGMMGPGATQGGDMMGMMNMMTQMSQMMETCNKMMQSAMRSPTQPEEEGTPAPQKQGG
jgi:hypothetical protein